MEVEVKQLIHDNAHPDDLIIDTDGSVLRGKRGTWVFVAKAVGKSFGQDSLAIDTTTSSMRMEVKAVLQLSMAREQNTYTNVTDCENLLRKMKTDVLSIVQAFLGRSKVMSIL